MKLYIYQLKFPTRAEWQQLKEQLTEQDGIITIVELGTLSEGGQWDNEGNVMEEPVIYEGYHVDIKTNRLIDELNQYIVTPQNPRHGMLWAEGCKIVQP
jgi:hypothetical protein